MDLKEKKLEELKKFAKKNKLVGYSKLNKSDLIKFIKKYIKSTKNKKNTKVLSKKSKSKSKKMVGGYVYLYTDMNPNVYIPDQTIFTQELPANTFTIYTTGIANAYLRYIWSFILAPKLKAIIPETRPLRIIHSELCDNSDQTKRQDFDRLRNYLTMMDGHVFGNRLIRRNGVTITNRTLDFSLIERSGLNNHFILDFAHLFKYSIDTEYLVYNRISDREADEPDTFEAYSRFRNEVYIGIINQIQINELIQTIARNQVNNQRTYNIFKNNIVSTWRRHNYDDAANAFQDTRYSYTLNVITFLFVGEPLNNYDILRYNNLFRYENGGIITYINDAIRNRKIFIANDPGQMFNSFNQDREINQDLFRNLCNYYNFTIDTENNIINNLLGQRNHINTYGHIFTFNQSTDFINEYNTIYPIHNGVIGEGIQGEEIHNGRNINERNNGRNNNQIHNERPRFRNIQ